MLPLPDVHTQTQYVSLWLALVGHKHWRCNYHQTSYTYIYMYSHYMYFPCAHWICVCPVVYMFVYIPKVCTQVQMDVQYMYMHTVQYISCLPALVLPSIHWRDGGEGRREK